MARNGKKVQLPAAFAQTLLDAEIQYKLSDVPSKETIKTLIQLYSVGVEYYQSIRSHKYLYFQLKMNQIFTSASAISAINHQKGSEQDSPLKKKMKSNLEQDKIEALQIKQKQQKMFQEIAQNANQTATVSTVKRMINQNQLKKQQVDEKVNKQLHNQDLLLKQKLKKRKSRLLFSKSFSTGFAENDTQDTLFTEVSPQGKLQGIQVKPIQVSFGNVINENESDDEVQKDEKVSRFDRTKSSITQNNLGKLKN